MSKQRADASNQPTTRKRANREKYAFTTADDLLLESALKSHGNGYAAIAKEFFSDKSPKVTGKDIQNYVNSSAKQHLRDVGNTAHDQLKNEVKRAFDMKLEKPGIVFIKRSLSKTSYKW
eukprot:TRINITY_DN8002_c0_g1_i1.p1 TRINITY_DN8002_c0_g1~~TRINITY_DN8002_c0_g1_i1.p1  ORF type:complete len:119 (+),score=40.30 TRINITY_DN8002_c0_g1_i1:38-394(+)